METAGFSMLKSHLAILEADVWMMAVVSNPTVLARRDAAQKFTVSKDVRVGVQIVHSSVNLY